MKIWIYTTKEIEEYLKLDEDEELKRASTDKAKKGDIILVYRGKPYSNIKYIFKAKTDAYTDKNFRDDWETAIDLDEKIVIPNPIEFSEMKDDTILGEWNIVRKNFMGSFFEMPSKEWDRIKKLILDKNPELKQEMDYLTPNQIITQISEDHDDNNGIKKWAFVIDRTFYDELKKRDEIKWNSHKDVKKDDIIIVYAASPYKSIGFILKAFTDPFEDREIAEKYNGRPAIMVRKKIEISEPITLHDLMNNPILSKWNPVNKKHFQFQGSHHKMSDEEYDELKKLILEKNPRLKEEIESIENDEEPIDYVGFGEEDYYDLSAGRAHIVRDICYLISKNPNLKDDDLFQLLRDKVGDNEDYWKAYYQRSNKRTSPKYNLNAARTLRFVEKNELSLTDLGKNLVDKITKDELFTFDYSLAVKKFYYDLALGNNSLKTAMRILKEKGRIRFASPVCDRTNKAFSKNKKVGNKYICETDGYSECQDCDRDYLAHMKESSLYFEFMKKTEGRGSMSVFWTCSRVTPMFLTGTKPRYSGNYIYWDEDAEKELGDLKNVTNNGHHEEKSVSQRIWKITPGSAENFPTYWPLYKENGYIGIGWVEIERDFMDFKSLDELKSTMEKVYGNPKPQGAKMIWDFTNEVKIGDYVVANRGYRQAVGIGIIKSDYIAPSDPDNPNLGERYPHLRKVEWKIIEDIELGDYFFDQKTVTELDGNKWNEIISSYARMKPKFRNKLLEGIYSEFKTNYLETKAGQDHLKAYEDESEKITRNYADIQYKRTNNIDATDEILYGLVPHKYKSIVGFVVDIKAFLEKNLDIKPEKFPEIADLLFTTINDLIKNDEDAMVQAEVLDNFITSDYSKGFGAGTLTPTLFFIDHKYPFINNKTVDTFNFLSNIIGQPIKIDNKLKHYIENKAKLEKFVFDLAEYLPGISDFAIFDIFCHWMCDKKLGYYTKGTPLPLMIEKPPTPTDCDPLFIKPTEIETKLKLDDETLHQVCGTLNAKKHIMLTGAPGTGKTDLAESVCKSVYVKDFSDGYILTTATSDWTTYDTIGGYMPSNDGKSLKFEEGKFLQAIKENKWLIIDEINRADIDKAFGQLFTVLSGQGVELPFKDGDKPIKIERTNKNRSYYDQETATYNVGNNWRIIATMNVFDKDYLFEMSYAFMRRFTFIYINLPSLEDFHYLIYDIWGEDDEDNYLSLIEGLLEINPLRPIGPAIFKDMVEYARERDKIKDPEAVGYDRQIIKDTILSFILPQFEGLELQKIHEIWNNILSRYDVDNDLKARLEEISGVSLVKKSREEDEE